MALHINNQNTNTSNIRIPFPPSIEVDEIVQLHLRNGIKSANQTMNAFLIYRKEYNHIVTKYNFILKDISSYATASWKQEPQHVKEYYKQLAKMVKDRFKEKVPSLCFVDCNDCNYVGTVDQFPIFTLDYERLAMDENEFMDHLSDDLALTYRAIIQSIPF
ncbi:3552_t:CDS:1 [Diversispora eburnea]|uniref:3552_t:CDS:1 n=1 Tax=Diversispora eburnea TaxID=1213867 RepID=A0A9N8VL31_9GLOM|nr:3552_t:CDS:1 [Diversispora eburnea]